MTYPVINVLNFLRIYFKKFSWQKSLDRLKAIKNKKKQMKEKLENKSIETMDQFAFRGMKHHGLVPEDVKIFYNFQH